MRRYHAFHGRRDPAHLGAEHVTAFLNSLAVQARVAAATQNQALAALLFLYRDVLGITLPWLDDLVHSRLPARLPVVLTRDEVRALLGQMVGVPRLMAPARDRLPIALAPRLRSTDPIRQKSRPVRRRCRHLARLPPDRILIVSPTMRCSPIGAVALLAACASTPVPYSVRDVVGHYQMMDGPECWMELELLPDGVCNCWLGRAVGVVTRAHVAGFWRIEGDAVAIDISNDEFTFMVGTRPLTLRRWDRHVYLVPPRDIAWFDECGPINEFCFSQEGAPLFSDPFSKRANQPQQPTSAPSGARG